MGNEGLKLKCSRCGYEWYTKSIRVYISCPFCRYDIKVEGNLKKMQEEVKE